MESRTDQLGSRTGQGKLVLLPSPAVFSAFFYVFGFLNKRKSGNYLDSRLLLFFISVI